VIVLPRNACVLHTQFEKRYNGSSLYALSHDRAILQKSVAMACCAVRRNQRTIRYTCAQNFYGWDGLASITVNNASIAATNESRSGSCLQRIEIEQNLGSI